MPPPLFTMPNSQPHTQNHSAEDDNQRNPKACLKEETQGLKKNSPFIVTCFSPFTFIIFLCNLNTYMSNIMMNMCG